MGRWEGAEAEPEAGAPPGEAEEGGADQQEDQTEQGGPGERRYAVYRQGFGIRN